jgi:hypothetical protein
MREQAKVLIQYGELLLNIIHSDKFATNCKDEYKESLVNVLVKIDRELGIE